MTIFSQLQFFSTPLASRMLQYERRWLEQQLRTCVGSHTALITSDPYGTCVDAFSDFYLAATISSDKYDKNLICAEATCLPLPNESLDVVVLQHVTDGSDNVVAILREAERVLVPGGRLLLLAENPWSLFGVCRWLFSDTDRRGSHNRHRYKQWLAALDIQIQSVRSIMHELPTSNRWLLRKTHAFARWLASKGMPFGGVYGMSAIKSARPVNPLRWQQVRWQTSRGAPVPAHATVRNRDKHEDS